MLLPNRLDMQLSNVMLERVTLEKGIILARSSACSLISCYRVIVSQMVGNVMIKFIVWQVVLIKAYFATRIKLKFMSNCIEVRRLTLPYQEVKSYRGMLRLASAIYQKPQDNLRIFFEGSHSAETEIESEDDLMALKYLVRQGNITFKVYISKSIQDIENELIAQTVQDYLADTYESVAEEEFQREVSQSIERYLQGLYRKLAEREAKENLKRIQKEEVSNYMGEMTRQIAQKAAAPRCLPVREKRARCVRVSPERELFRRKQSHIQSMVSRILESMMPVMVKELSDRIVQQLQNDKHFMALQEQQDLNPEYF